MKNEITVAEYLTYFGRQTYPALFAQADLQKLQRVRSQFGDKCTEETILEVPLSLPEKKCDYSIKINTGSKNCKEYWYELDSSACLESGIAPCYFIDASPVIPGQDNSRFYENILKPLAGPERLQKLLPMVERCVAGLTGRCGCLFQFGAMTGRGQDDSLRLFTDDLTKEDLVAYLQSLDWQGDARMLMENLTKWEPFSDQEKFILDFDVFEDHISHKIGINFGTKKKDEKTVAAWLDFLVSQGLCIPEKRDDVLRFSQALPCRDPFILNDISHFKIPICDGRILLAKAYMRQGTVFLRDNFRAYDGPFLMNLELTSRCPLHCPQCYCDLNNGKDLALDKALYWIRDAAKNGVKVVNLSGGETLCYHHLYELLEAVSSQGMEPNIAISGWGVTREVLEKIISCGVADICVSLNGSTAAINAKTRDGYPLARRALELLDELKFPRTVINWVMHSFNTDDFPNIVKIAEEHHVSQIAIIVFKPDSSHCLPSVPTAEQVRNLAKFIKAYKGPVQLEAEECFSQLRALLGQHYFYNSNMGVSRGCGAGRDGISISADGKLTPCRHLELEEDFDNIHDYWENSPVLKILRSVEDHPGSPCSECQFRHNCLPCMAVNYKMNNTFLMGDNYCPIKPEPKKE